MILAWFSVATVFVIGMIVYLFMYTHWRRKRAAAKPFPAHWQTILQRNMALYQRLPPELRDRLHRLILIFLDEKRFYGCDGLTVTEPMRVIIAAHACLLVLNRGIYHYDKLRSILIYPSVYRAHEEVYDLGVQSHQMSSRLGESWHQGRVILSWIDVLDDSQTVHEGENVALHEFSHQLDQVNGAADGLPILAQQQSIQEWSQVFQQEFERLRGQVGTSSVINEYGAQNPAEFFAVATEAFFTNPEALKQQRPQLYEQLQFYYQLDPASWPQPQMNDGSAPGPIGSGPAPAQNKTIV